jgi:hypothetical protein
MGARKSPSNGWAFCSRKSQKDSWLMPFSKPIPLDPALEALIEKARHHVMTPAEIWDQRVSFVYGQMMDCAPEITREQVEARVTEMHGPRPSE